ncbi:glycerophosphodiester phosphodiesterase family protein [Roseibium sp. Sym1]|uniref:glycerophosphodiester phosphodiesterase family protein n=1 Tax=Roseibium sp. Sym1 TaxID=3016006 RepID=UPI0022B378AE|nr:glycerophosphodiester phosphodiesterase family protein [Roseibium sp. Sym1]
MARKLALVLVLAGLALYAANASWLAASPETGRPTLIAHRGVHQTYDRKDIGRDTCTATRIATPSHAYLENTEASMEAAFAAGAAIVELDIHPTTDGHFAVFHDWTLDCRTNGTGVTRDHDLTELQTLDIGYGYTADGGRTHPFRGKDGVRMPALSEVLDRFPDGLFLVNFKSRDASEADRLHTLLLQHPEWKERIWGVYGGASPTQRFVELTPGVRGFTKEDTKSCLLGYIVLGWSGHVPASCRNRQILVPVNYAVWLWGWPNRFLQRMEENGAEIVLSGPPKGTAGIDTLEQLAKVPEGFGGYIWTNRIEVIGPALGKRK